MSFLHCLGRNAVQVCIMSLLLAMKLAVIAVALICFLLSCFLMLRTIALQILAVTIAGYRQAYWWWPMVTLAHLMRGRGGG